MRSHVKSANRRRSHRISATDRVEYEQDGRRNVSFLSNLSLTGMLLRGAADLKPHADARFRLHLDGLSQPISIDGRPQGSREAGTAVAFLPGQHQAQSVLESWIQEH